MESEEVLTLPEWIDAHADTIVDLFVDFQSEHPDSDIDIRDFSRYLYSQTYHGMHAEVTT